MTSSLTYYIGPTASTEIFEVGFSSQWTEVSPLPYKMLGPRATTVNNLIYLTGEDSGQDGLIS